MECLTKENFWNNLMQSNPEELEKFCQWIDEYKKGVNWSKLFNYGPPHYATAGWHNPKYHDLPLAIQKGIFLEYIQRSNSNPDSSVVTKIALALEFAEVQDAIQTYFNLVRTKS
jgi:hypothetical protein